MNTAAPHDILDESDFPRLFLQQVPLLDVRAPVEFLHGAFPGAVNLPLLNDEERDQVGKTYRRAGHDAAVALGHALVSGTVREQRLQQWQTFLQQNPGAALYCFRGGQRSRIAQQWLAEAGVNVPRIRGGYKALRRFLINRLELPVSSRLLLIAGRTGSGKTSLLNQFVHSIDLEALAAHRGSAFGRRVQPQPTQINFENAMAIALLRLLQDPPPAWLLAEDESRAIGSLSIPLTFYQSMRTAPLAVIEEPVELRAQVILRDYIQVNFLEYRAAFPQQHEQLFADYLKGSLLKIRKRLGAELFVTLDQALQQALCMHFRDGDPQAHAGWISDLLTRYYDPMYEYQLGTKSDRIVFRGNSREFLSWASHLLQPRPAPESA